MGSTRTSTLEHTVFMEIHNAFRLPPQPMLLPTQDPAKN